MIPSDIQAKAEYLCGFLEAMPSVGNFAAIAEALMAERENAARLVETWADDHLTVQPSFTLIAAAIRKGERESGLMLSQFDLAEAVMNERERCAMIAESNNHWPQEGDYIASLIRSPDNARSP